MHSDQEMSLNVGGAGKHPSLLAARQLNVKQRIVAIEGVGARRGEKERAEKPDVNALETIQRRREKQRGESRLLMEMGSVW